MHINLFCIPFAGGSKSAYHSYVSRARDVLTVIPLELPGRGSRYKESLLTDVYAMVDDLLRQIRPALEQPYALYGHSMGALLCYLLSARIIREEINGPIHLFLTGKGAPSVKAHGNALHLLPRDELVKELRRMGGTPDIVLSDNKLLDLFLPVIRADFEALENFRYEAPANLNVPITVITGSEETISAEGIEAWKLETCGQVETIVLPGNHFFIFEHVSEIIKLIAQTLYSYNLKNKNATYR
jgi:surfactin synthase thioesterase subunit